MLTRLIARFRAMASGRDIDRELDDELRLHLDIQTQMNAQAGMPPDRARRAALLAFGGVEQAKEAARDARALWWDSIWRDLGFGCRVLRRNPGFAAAVVLTFGLGIGANSAIFSIVNGLVLRPLPVRDADRLAVVAVSREAGGAPGLLSRLDFEDYRDQADAFEDLAGYAMGVGGLAVGSTAERVWITYVSGNYFSMLGLKPAVGRLIHSDEGRVAGADQVLVLSHTYWRQRFAADPGVIGKAVRVNGRPFTIVGVAPEGFRGAYAFVDIDLFTPISMIAADPAWGNAWSSRADGSLIVLGRLKRGVSLPEARALLAIVGRRLAAQYPDTNRDVRPLAFWENHARPDASAASVLPAAASLFIGLVVLVLVVACVNVAGLLLARGTARVRELTLRNALGAGRLRLVQQLVTESLLLALLGGLAGLVLGAWSSRILAGIRLPNDIPMRLDFGLDWRVLIYVTAVALLSGVVAGLLPALRVSATTPADACRAESRESAAGTGGRHRLRDLLVVAQVAGSLALLVVAALFVRSLERAQRVELGFQPDGVMNFFMDPKDAGYSEVQTTSFYRELIARVSALPGVVSASLAYSMPLGYYNISQRLDAEGQDPGLTETLPVSDYNLVDAAYLRTLGIQLQRGRWLSQADVDDRRPVAVVNESLARRLWPGEDPLGRRFRFHEGPGPWLEVIGVGDDGKYGSVLEQPRGFFYLPLSMEYRSLHVLHVRLAGDPQRVVPLVRHEMKRLAPEVPVFDVTSMWDAVKGGNGFFLLRIAATCAAALGLLGMALALVGLYGVVSYSAGQRTREIGIRMALGAERRTILAMVVGRGLRLVAVGGVAGIVAALGLSRFVASLLFGVAPHDLLTYGVVAGLLVLVGTGACYLPARRATRVDPTVALRGE